MTSGLHNSTVAYALRTRPYGTEDDLRQMQDLLMEARSRSDDWRYPHVGDLMWTFFMVACHLDPREHIRLWHDADGQLAGYAILGEDPSFDCQALPESHRDAIAAEAMAWAETRLLELRKHDPRLWGGELVSGARQDDERRKRFLERQGFRPAEYSEVNLMRSLADPIPAPVLPAGCRVCAAVDAGPVSNRASIQREVWHPWSVGNVSDDDYSRLMRLPGYNANLDVVAVMPDGVIAAYVNGWIEPLDRIGDFGPVGTRPACRQQGFARAVLLEGLRRMKACGMDRVCVSTGDSNTPALRLYESVGFEARNKYLEYVKKAL